MSNPVVTTEADSLVTQASHLHAAGQTHQALVRLEAALGLEPANIFALLLRGRIAVEQRDAAAALPRLRAVLRLQPHCAPALADLAQALWLAGQPTDGLDPARRAVELDPGNAQYRLNLAQLCVWLGRGDEAPTILAPLLADAGPMRARARGMLAIDLVMQGDFLAADRVFAAAVAEGPDAAGLVRAYGLNLLRLGRLTEGWPLIREPVPLPGTLWQGEDLAGRTILLRDSQGLGDSIQMLRYLPMLRERRPGRVVLFTLPAMRRLFATAAPWVEVVDRLAPDLHPDVHCLTMDLPWRFGTTLDTIPAPIPYLPAMPGPRLGPGRHVGLVWSGNAKHLNDLNRSIPAHDFLRATARVPGLRFHALQADPPGRPGGAGAVSGRRSQRGTGAGHGGHGGDRVPAGSCGDGGYLDCASGGGAGAAGLAAAAAGAGLAVADRAGQLAVVSDDAAVPGWAGRMAAGAAPGHGGVAALREGLKSPPNPCQRRVRDRYIAHERHFRPGRGRRPAL